MLGRRPSPDSTDPSSDGSHGTIVSFLQGLQSYLAARTELLGIESREAAAFAKRKTLFGIILGVLAFFGYALILVALVPLLGFAISAILPDSLNAYGWPLGALLLAGLHLLAVLILANKLRQPPESPLFEVTRAEFQKDREWINDQQSNSESNS